MTFPRRICAFAGCSCAANPHHEIAPYCSAYCAVADREAAEGACSCGHDACEAVGQAMSHAATCEVHTSVGVSG